MKRKYFMEQVYWIEKYKKAYKKALLCFLIGALISLLCCFSNKELSISELSRKKSINDEYEVTVGDSTFEASLFVKKKIDEDKSRKNSPIEEINEEENLKNSFVRFFTEEERKTRQEEVFVFPSKYNGMSVTYRKKKSATAGYVVVLAFVVFLLIIFNEKAKEDNEKKKDDEKLKKQYPAFVYILTLLIGSGMSIQNAIERIIDDELLEEGLLREAVIRMNLGFHSGLSLGDGLKRFSDEIGLREYRKLVALILQNRKQGAAGLNEILSLEISEAEELDYNRARIAAEKTGGKLLITITALLLIVIVILLGPAYLMINNI